MLLAVDALHIARLRTSSWGSALGEAEVEVRRVFLKSTLSAPKNSSGQRGVAVLAGGQAISAKGAPCVRAAG